MGDVNIKPTLPSEHQAAPTIHEVNAAAEASAEASAPVQIEAPPAPATRQEQVVQPADPAVPLAPVQPAWGSLLMVLLFAGLVSGVLVRLGRMQVLVQVRRWAPLAQLLVWALAILAGARVALNTFPIPWLIFMGLASLLLGAAGMSAMRSAIAGLGIALEGRLTIGDTVQIGQLQGEIVAFGLRAARLRSPNGMTHDIPNERFMSEAVSTLGGAGGEAVCEVTVSIPSAIPVEAALELAREGAVLSPLSSPRHRPEVFLDVRRAGAPSVIRIRGYAFDPDYHDHFRSDVIRRVGHAVAAYQRKHEGVPIVGLGDESSSPLLT